MKETYTAIIPVRAGSQRLKNKNILPFGDSNLLIHKIRQLKNVSAIDTIVVSSDSDQMLGMALSEGVQIHKRDPLFCDEKSKTFNEFAEYMAQEIEGDHIIWAHCTSPLLDSANFYCAIECYQQNVLPSHYYDSLVTVNLLKERVWDEEKPLNYTMERHVLTQELPNWYIITNGIYLTSRKLMLENKRAIGFNPYLFEVDKMAAVDVDDEIDIEMARAIYNYQQGRNRSIKNDN